MLDWDKPIVTYNKKLPVTVAYTYGGNRLVYWNDPETKEKLYAFSNFDGTKIATLHNHPMQVNEYNQDEPFLINPEPEDCIIARLKDDGRYYTIGNSWITYSDAKHLKEKNPHYIIVRKVE